MKSKTKQIISTTSLCLVVALIAIVIILAIIPTYKGVTFFNKDAKFTASDRPDIITVRTSSNKELQYHNNVQADQKMYDKLWTAYENAGSYSLLNSILIGISAKQQSPERLAKSSSSMSTLFDANDEYCMIFTWYEGRSMMNANGTVFKYTAGGNEYEPPKYARAYFSITAENVITKAPIYLVEQGRDFKSATTRYVYNGYFNTSSLYQYLATLDFHHT